VRNNRKIAPMFDGNFEFGLKLGLGFCGHGDGCVSWLSL
jgi:hypothetical protein